MDRIIESKASNQTISALNLIKTLGKRENNTLTQQGKYDSNQPDYII